MLYVSNVNGPPLDKDGNGFISKLSPEGEIEELEWITGLNAPKGMIMDGDKLYVTDIDRLVEIDPETGKIVGTYPAEGAIFLNDPAVGPDSTVYVSDIAGRKIFARAPGADTLEIWFAPDDLMHIIGLTRRGRQTDRRGLGPRDERRRQREGRWQPVHHRS